jgi:phosphate transport system substrate-binding protein
MKETRKPGQTGFEKKGMGLVIVSLLSAFLLSGPLAAADEVLKIGGTGGILGAMRLLGGAYEKNSPGVTVKVFPSLGSRGGVDAVSKRAIDIGLSVRPMNETLRKLDFSALEFARSPFVLTTGKGTAVSGLSTEELVKIYRGETQTWSDGQRLRVVLRPASDSDTILIKTLSAEMSQAVDAALSRPGMLSALTDQDCLDAAEDTPGALALSTLTQILTEKRSVKILALNGVKPSLKTLSDQTYPHYKTFFIVTRREPADQTRRFLSFIQSPKGRKILEASGNLPNAERPGK